MRFSSTALVALLVSAVQVGLVVADKSMRLRYRSASMEQSPPDGTRTRSLRYSELDEIELEMWERFLQLDANSMSFVQETDAPTSSPTKTPFAAPTSGPTVNPTEPPTPGPTLGPTGTPSIGPTTQLPTSVPTTAPTIEPTDLPSLSPTTGTPTEDPSEPPISALPTESPVVESTAMPTGAPISESPTITPLAPSTARPIQSPVTGMPTQAPVAMPVENPTSSPATGQPSIPPTGMPATTEPTLAPVSAPTRAPGTSVPTGEPTTGTPIEAPVSALPTGVPVSASPTVSPVSASPVAAPVVAPTSAAPTLAPVVAPVTEAPTTAAPVPAPVAPPIAPPVAAPVATTESPTSSPTLGEVTLEILIRNEPELTTLLSVLETADANRNSPPFLLDILSDTENAYTAFAPNNAAFEALEGVAPGYAAKLVTADYGLQLFDILSYHVAQGSVSTSDFPINNLPMLGSGSVNATIRGDGTFGLGSFAPADSIVVLPDVSSLNGVAHIMDKVLLPRFFTQNLCTALDFFDETVTDTFSTFKRLLAASGIDEVLAVAQGVTLLAPTNNAIPAETEEYLLAPGNEMVLMNVLRYHIITELFNYATQSVPNILLRQTLQGENIVVGLVIQSSGDISISYNQATQLDSFVVPDNIGYAIDTILVPPSLSTIVPRSVMFDPEEVFEQGIVPLRSVAAPPQTPQTLGTGKITVHEYSDMDKLFAAASKAKRASDP